MSVKLLLVDDELEFTNYVRKRLKRREIDVETVHDGESAIDRVRQAEYDVVVLDIHMPGINGLDTLRTIQALRPGLPVIMLTGNRQTETAVSGIKLGAYDYLVKPCDINALTRAILDAKASRS